MLMAKSLGKDDTASTFEAISVPAMAVWFVVAARVKGPPFKTLRLARGVSDVFATVVDLPLAIAAFQNVFGRQRPPFFE